MTKICARCKVPKDLDQFHKNPTKKDSVSDMCKECRKSYHTDWYSKNKKVVYDHNKTNKAKVQRYLRDYLEQHPCVDCGEPDPIVLEFDHIKGQKLFNLADAPTRRVGLSKLEAEIQKCEVRCANCHRRKTAARRNNTPPKL